ncbi:unnamed protein product [Cuscuta epithymum]|uniref:Uncharacterized protein n=1 Tax=Cuscuta epithymum TaxID=186058 RepID=A0AAV0CHZ1_9ASTE|nr:unnamed protein product [Cuscuta epithymum]
MDAFKYEMKRLVNDLKITTDYAEEKIENIEAHVEVLLQNSKEIQDSFSVVDLRTQNLEKASKNVEEHVNVVLTHSSEIHEHIKSIAASQKELSDEHAPMKMNLVEGMEILQASYRSLGKYMNELKSEVEEITKEIGKVGKK